MSKNIKRITGTGKQKPLRKIKDAESAIRHSTRYMHDHNMMGANNKKTSGGWDIAIFSSASGRSAPTYNEYMQTAGSRMYKEGMKLGLLNQAMKNMKSNMPDLSVKKPGKYGVDY